MSHMVQVCQNSIYFDQGAKAKASADSSDFDSQLTQAIQTTFVSFFDTSIVLDSSSLTTFELPFKVLYDVTDSEGNSAETVTRAVEVKGDWLIESIVYYYYIRIHQALFSFLFVVVLGKIKHDISRLASNQPARSSPPFSNRAGRQPRMR